MNAFDTNHPSHIAGFTYKDDVCIVWWQDECCRTEVPFTLDGAFNFCQRLLEIEFGRILDSQFDVMFETEIGSNILTWTCPFWAWQLLIIKIVEEDL